MRASLRYVGGLSRANPVALVAHGIVDPYLEKLAVQVAACRRGADAALPR
jgi:hypothetical protein